MKQTLIALILACVSVTAFAASRSKPAPKIDDVFKGVTFTQPKCFGREYSRQELKARPLQTVEQIKLKLMKYAADPVTESRGLKIEVRLAKEEGMNYHAEFSCQNYKGEMLCGIDCDGGHVDIAAFNGTSMTLINDGFMIQGGCGDEGTAVTKFLKAVKGGDDVFKLQALPQSYCTDASTGYHEEDSAEGK